MSKQRHIAYFITAHGRGHAVRCAQVIQELAAPSSGAAGARVTAITMVPEGFLREQVSAAFEVVAGSFDCGTIHKEGDHTVDPALTLDAYGEVSRRNAAIAEEWAGILGRMEPDVIVTDVAAFPHVLAKRLGVPGVIVSNFTWYDIYAPLIGGLPGGAAVLEELRWQYGCASQVLVPPMDLPMEWLSGRRAVPLIARKGRDRSGVIREALGIRPEQRMVLFYAGPVRLSAGFWAQVGQNPDFAFVVYGGQPEVPELANLYRLPGDLVHPADVVPSMDLVLAKAGYGIASECMANGVPLVYAHRADFLESVAIARELGAWGGAVSLAPEVLLSGCALRPYLVAAAELAPVRAVRSDGAACCAEWLLG